MVGVNPEATAAHAALESGFGQSQLTREANNLFGVTKGSWPGPVINLPTREYVDGEWVTVTRPFRRYATWLESVTDYAGIAARLYPWAVEHRANPLAWLTGLFILGPYRWATDPAIYPKVVSILDKFDLLDPRPEQHQLGLHDVLVDNHPTLGKAVGQAVAVFAREPAIIRAPHLVTRTRRADGSWKLDVDLPA